MRHYISIWQKWRKYIKMKRKLISRYYVEFSDLSKDFYFYRTCLKRNNFIVLFMKLFCSWNTKRRNKLTIRIFYFTRVFWVAKFLVTWAPLEIRVFIFAILRGNASFVPLWGWKWLGLGNTVYLAEIQTP